MDSREMAKLVVQALEDKKGEDKISPPYNLLVISQIVRLFPHL